MKTAFRIVTEKNRYRFGGSSHDLWAGSFSHVNCNHSDYVMYFLDSFDKSFIESKNIKLKPGEFIFRCTTDTSKLTGLEFFVKINVLKGLVYFNAADSDTEDVVFETRGNKMTYLNLKSDDYFNDLLDQMFKYEVY